MIRRVAGVIGLVGACIVFGVVSAKTFSSASTSSQAASPLPTYCEVPMFSLVDQDGQIVTRSSLEGSVWVADFIFTRCAGQCPLMSQRMAMLQEAFVRLPQVRCISFSVDPAYDSPVV